MPKRLTERYTPGIIPATSEGLIPFLYDELQRIAIGQTPFVAGMNVSDNPVDVPIGQPGAVYPLFIDQIAGIDVPGGYWDPPAGAYTIPTNGFYSGDLIAQVQGLNQPGNAIYVINLSFLVNGIIAHTASNSGSDVYPLSASISFTKQLFENDVVTAQVQLEHATKTGVVPGEFDMSIVLAGGT